MLPSSGWSLRLRLLLSVGIVLLLPALFSLMQGIASARHHVADLREQLISTARATASPAENILVSARAVTLALSRIPAIRDGTPGCNDDLANALDGIPFLANMARVDASGRIVCAAKARSVGRDLTYLPVWPTIAGQKGFVVSGMTMSRLTHRPVVLGLLPLHDASGRFLGTLNVVIDVGWLNNVLKSSALPPGSLVAIFDRHRNMIAATDASVARAVFALSDLGTPASIQTGLDENGVPWSYATAALLGQDVYVGLAMPDTELYGAAYAHATIDMFLPFVMILLTWAAIWVVTDRQLTRWIIYLRRISAAYRSGHYALRPSLDGAPSEIKLLGGALAEMAGSIYDRDRSLREAIAQKSLLIKEIHHRVKNNLQVVMSLLSLQTKRLKDAAAQEALRDTRTRINALALVHRILYEIDDQNTVDAKQLLEQLAEQIGEGFGGEGRNLHVIADVLPRELSSEAAVTLSLFAVEAVTNAFKHAFPDDRAGTIRLVLEKSGENCLRLAVEDNGVGFEGDDNQSSIGSRLMRTFGQQIGGTTRIRSDAGCGTTIEIVFPDPAQKSCRATKAG